jgi:hypothetical protein
MNLPHVQPAAVIIDLTDWARPAPAGTFLVDDRVKRRAGTSEKSQWGTIVGSAQDDWLVLDNNGVTHQDRAVDLLPALHGQLRCRSGSVGLSPGSRGTLDAQHQMFRDSPELS